jgi:hypothetical protein
MDRHTERIKNDSAIHYYKDQANLYSAFFK